MPGFPWSRRWTGCRLRRSRGGGRYRGLSRCVSVCLGCIPARSGDGRHRPTCMIRPPVTLRNIAEMFRKPLTYTPRTCTTETKETCARCEPGPRPGHLRGSGGEDLTQSSPTSGETRSIPALLARNAALYADRPAYREKEFGIWQSWTWAETRKEIDNLALGLLELGVARAISSPS